MDNLISRFLPLFALLASGVHAADHCVVLQYHHVARNTPGVTSVTPERFQEHLDYLRDGAFDVMALEEVVARLQDGRELPERCVSLSIDDAYASTYTEAWPRARRYGFPLTVFVSTESVDIGSRAFLTWEQLREMAAAGVSLQNHSHSHDHLIRRNAGESQEDWEQRMASEIQLAQNRLRAETGTEASLFAYPYGEFTPALGRIVRSMNLVGFGQQSGPAWRGADFAALPRFPMASVYADMRTFPLKVTTLPLPLIDVQPRDPVVALDDWTPTLTLTFEPGSVRPKLLNCFVNGDPDVDKTWSEDRADSVRISARRRIPPGRSRYNCTLPVAGEPGRFHWYSHNWFRRHADGSWYSEPR